MRHPVIHITGDCVGNRILRTVPRAAQSYYLPRQNRHSWVVRGKDMRNLCHTIIAVLGAAALVGCATTLTSEQKREYKVLEAKGLSVQEKNPGTGAALGILPGGGSFYARSYGCGVLNLVLWPASILWDPVSGYEGSLTINYYATMASVDTKMRKDIGELDDELATGLITNVTYIQQKHVVETRYAAN